MHDCATIREALSARLDDETPPGPADAVEAHLAGCPDCRRFRAAAERLEVSIAGSGLRDAPERTATLLTAMAAPSRRRARRRQGVLAALGIVHVVVALIELVGVVPTSPHASRELAAWTIALGAGFLAAAVRPALARGVLPVAATMAAAALVVVVPEVAAGRASLADQTLHVSQGIGAVVLWRTARTAALDLVAPARPA